MSSFLYSSEVVAVVQDYLWRASHAASVSESRKIMRELRAYQSMMRELYSV